MGQFFNKFKSYTKGINIITPTVELVKGILDDFEIGKNNDFDSYMVTAWLCRVGIIDILEKTGIGMTNKILVNINGHLTRMPLIEAYMLTVGRLSVKAGELDDESRLAIENVLEKGDLFYKVDSQIPDKDKAKYRL